MKKKPEPKRPEEKTFPLSFRYVTTKYADAAAYKGHVVITMPSDRQWMTSRDARRFAESVLAAVKLQESIDAWYVKYRPQSYEAIQAKRLRRR